MQSNQSQAGQRLTLRRVARVTAIAAVALAAGFTVVADPPSEAAAKPSGGTEVSVEPVMKPVTVTQTTPASSPPIPFATPTVRAPQAGAA